MSGAPADYDVFLSYSRADEAAANALRDRLVDDGKFQVFIDWRALLAGRPWQPALEAALGSCRAMVVVLGPERIAGWQHREIQLGLDRQTGADQTGTAFPVIPVLLPGLEPHDYPLGTFLALNTWVAFDKSVDEPGPLQRLLTAIQGHPLDGLTRDFAALRPYRGLLPFREQDAGLFFGRQRFVEELTAKVRQRSASNVVGVLGRSGSGKSSVVFAGLFPALRRERGLGQQAVWNIASLRPGRQPLLALIETFDPPEPGLGETEILAALNRRANLLRKGEVTLAQLVTRRIEQDKGTTRQLLYVDQWEELYTQAQPHDARTDEGKARAADVRLFVDLVLDAARAPCTLVLSVRSDFYPDLQTHDRLRAAVQDCQVSLGPMRREELTAAIEGPAKALGGSVEAELTKRLLRDIGLAAAPGAQDQYDIGKLPLLEYALEQAWAKAKEGRLGVAHYAGLEQALEDRANDVYDSLSEQQQAAAKRLFVSLVTPGEGREDTRARIVLGPDSELAPAAEAFAAGNARLVVTGDDGGARAVEVSHEALIRHWERLRTWIDESRANLRTRADLVADRAEWLRHGRDPTLLIPPGLRLEGARKLKDEPGDVRTDDLLDYIQASDDAEIAARKAIRLELESRHLRELQTQQAIAEKALADREAAKAQAALNEVKAQQVAAELAQQKAQSAAQRSRFGLYAVGALTVATIAVGAYFLSEQRRDSTEQGMRNQEQLTLLADLHGVAVANRDLPIGTLPEARRAMLYQEVAVLLDNLEAPRALGGTTAYRMRLEALEGEGDRTARHVLARTVERYPVVAPVNQDRWLALVSECVFRADPSSRRQVLKVGMVPLGATGSAATDDLQPVFAMLTLIDNRPQLETVRFDKTAVGHAFSPHFAPIFCRIGSDRTPLDVAAVGDATMDPQAHWLVERPRTSRGSVSATARLRRLDWFQICARPSETGTCAPNDRQWHVEVYDLGPNVDLQQDGLMPRAPADMPAVTPRFLDGETAAALAPALARPSDATGQLHTDASDTAPGAQAGDALYWGAQPLVNARPGFRIPAYAFDQDSGILAYVATTLAPNARVAANSQGPTTCEGQELCTHYLRMLHFDPEDPEAEDGTRVPLLEILFVVPPIDRVAFGEEELAGDLLFHFAGVDGAARLTWDHKRFKNWICRVHVSDTSAEPTSGYTQPFENFALSAAAESSSRKAIIERACNAS